MDRNFFEECVDASANGAMKFPAIVAKLTNAGVESYHVDMVRGENRYYLSSGESHVVTNKIPPAPAAEKFSAAEVEAAVRSSQAGAINYPQFMQQIAAAGTVYYITYIKGKKVIYFGRNGDAHTEYFPGSR